MLSQEKDLVHAYHQPMAQQFTKARVTTLMRTSGAYSRTNGTEPNINIPKANLGKGSLDIMWSGKDNTPGYDTLHLRMQHIAVCAFCLTNRKGSNATFQREGFRDWKNAVGEKRGIISDHGNTPGHMAASELVEDSLSVCKGQRKDIHSVISKTYSNKVQTNRNVLSSVLDIILNLGKRNVGMKRPMRRMATLCNTLLSGNPSLMTH